MDARLLAQRAFGLDSLGLSLAEGRVADPDQLARLDELAGRRHGGEPVARILGEQEFYGISFALSPATLVPRPETELLVDRGLGLLGKLARPKLLDLGTGTGCIAISILAHHPGARAVAVDRSAEALDVASANAERHGVADRLDLRHGSWFQPVLGESFDVVVSNPPYIETREIPDLAREVKDFEPRLALHGGVDGLDGYREIAAGAADRLMSGGALLLEVGHRQASAVTAILEPAGFRQIVVHKDLAGLDRVIEAHHIVTNTP